VLWHPGYSDARRSASCDRTGTLEFSRRAEGEESVKATLAAIADGAGVGVGDKLHVQGVFDTIFADTFPAVHARMVVVVRLQLEPDDDSREYTVRVRLVDDVGRRIVEQTTRAHVGHVPHGTAPADNLIYQLTNTTFRGPGRYRFRIDAGQSHLDLPLRVLGRET
jgi:hypothetical protein